MPDPVIYVRGFPLGLGGPSEAHHTMLEDLKAVSGLADAQVEAIRKRLLETKGFLSTPRLLALIRDVVNDENTARSVQRAVRNLAPSEVESFLKNLSGGDGDKRPRLEKDILDELRKKLPRLIQPYPALARQQKAERVAALTGDALESIQLVCDLRPVFDESRKEVEGMMPYTRLRLVVTGVDGLPRSFNAELTHQQVHDLADKAKKAIAKLDVLREVVEKWLPGGLPDLPLTRVTSKESDDA